jgi:hypothetical protein
MSQHPPHWHHNAWDHATDKRQDEQQVTTIMPANFIAVLPKYKLEQGPTFLLACDATGIDWLRCRFAEFSVAPANSSFVVGNGNPIASDGRCELTITLAEAGSRQLISAQRNMTFIWRIPREDSEEVATKLSILRDTNVPCHQYFGDGGGPYQTIVVTKNEEPIDLIRAMRDCKPWVRTNT